MESMRVMLADDHAVVRAGVKALVEAQVDMDVVGEASDGVSAVDLTRELQPHVLVVDISMPGLNGAQVVQQIKQVCPSVRVVTLTVHEDRSYLRQLLQAGANGYVLKRSAAEELIRAIRTVADGGTYIDPLLAGKLVSNAPGRRSVEDALQRTQLSEREEEVLRLIAEGHSNKLIANRLGLSTKTVETYKTRSLEKLGLHTRADIVRHALQQGWLSGDSPQPSDAVGSAV